MAKNNFYNSSDELAEKKIFLRPLLPLCMATLGVGKLIVNCATELKLGNLKMKFNSKILN